MSALTDSPQWKALLEHQATLSDRPIASLFFVNPDRASQFSLEAAGLLLDYSKNRVDENTMGLLTDLAKASGMQEAIAAMFAGGNINNTEQRPALHVALRSPNQDTGYEQAVHAALQTMGRFVDQVTSWQWQGYAGEPVTDVVNIGIGGSDLGPAMVYTALGNYHLDGIRVHFVSNVDPAHLEQTLETLEPATTLFVIASKSFTTMETSLNAQAARQWFLDACGDESQLAKHFVAVSANVDKARAFGIAGDNIFPLWDWVGGRYSLWSAIGLPVALGIGMDNFRALLNGAHAMDEHFRAAALAENMPVLMALLDCWYQNFFAAESGVILPYSQQLHLFPAFLQQLDMESLGKSVDKSGQPVAVATGGIVWGSAGTNGQHSFHQLLHQGTHLIPADFIAVAHSASANIEQHQQLLANCFAQSQALMDGKSVGQARQELIDSGMDATEADALAPHKAIAGNKPSNTIVMDTLTPESLGALVACYEHKVYARSVILGINAFDQWGVELGKVLSGEIYSALVSKDRTDKFDASTNNLINRCKR